MAASIATTWAVLIPVILNCGILTTKAMIVEASSRHRHFSEQYSHDLCRTVYCRTGEQCSIRNEVARCICRERCPVTGGQRLACGTDGIIYKSHCLLHQSACLKKQRISITDIAYCQNPEQFRHGKHSKSDASPSSTTPKLPEESIYIQPLSPGGTHIDCTSSNIKTLLESLLLYSETKHHDTSETGAVTHKDKSENVSILFSELDANSDGVISKNDLQQINDKYITLEPASCQLSNILPYLDINSDGTINKTEFYKGYNLKYVPVAPFEKVVYHTVKLGTQYELLCSIKPTPKSSLEHRILWQRYNVAMTSVPEYKIEVNRKGELYLIDADFAHAGNFTCQISYDPHVEQVHIVKIVERPEVNITPPKTELSSGQSIEIYCDIEKGYPKPQIDWFQNDKLLYKDGPGIIEITDADTEASGKYECVATNPQGQDKAMTFLDVKEELSSGRDLMPKDQFAVLYSEGIRIYNADDCMLVHSLSESYPVAHSDGDYLCSKGRCFWGDVVVSKAGNYMYSILPDQKEVVIVDISRGNVHEVIHMNYRPTRLWYLPWLDSVWVESFEEGEGDHRTLQVIRSATQGIQHTLTHALPTKSSFDKISNLFLPTENAKYGYFTRAQQTAIERIDLKTLHRVSTIDLSHYNCHPVSAAFILIESIVILECRDPATNLPLGQLVLDYLSDGILSTYPTTHGMPYWFPKDPGRAYTLVKATGRIIIQDINHTALAPVASVDEYLPLHDFVFRPNTSQQTAHMLALSTASTNLARIDLYGKKVVYPMKDVFQNGNIRKNADNPVFRQRKNLLGRDAPSQHLIISNPDSVLSVRLANLHKQCDVTGLKDIRLLAWT